MVQGLASYSATYDKQGNLVAETYLTDFNADGVVDNSFSTSASYDKWGNLVQKVYVSDYDGDGTPDSTSTLTLTY